MSTSGQNRISIALCTYNGERFLNQQLASMAQQTRLPDELVVCDDRSTDRTLTMVREFAASAPYPVRIFQNEQNLGFAANFERAIRLCQGNLIALSDQDDIWYPIRLQRSEHEFTCPSRSGSGLFRCGHYQRQQRSVRSNAMASARLRGQARAPIAGWPIRSFGEAQVCDRSYRDVSRRPA